MLCTQCCLSLEAAVLTADGWLFVACSFSAHSGLASSPGVPLQEGFSFPRCLFGPIQESPSLEQLHTSGQMCPFGWASPV